LSWLPSFLKNETSEFKEESGLEFALQHNLCHNS